MPLIYAVLCSLPCPLLQGIACGLGSLLGSAGKELEEAVKGNLIPRNPLGVDCVLMAHR